MTIEDYEDLPEILDQDVIEQLMNEILDNPTDDNELKLECLLELAVKQASHNVNFLSDMTSNRIIQFSLHHWDKTCVYSTGGCIRLAIHLGLQPLYAQMIKYANAEGIEQEVNQEIIEIIEEVGNDVELKLRKRIERFKPNYKFKKHKN